MLQPMRSDVEFPLTASRFASARINSPMSFDRVWEGIHSPRLSKAPGPSLSFLGFSLLLVVVTAAAAEAAAVVAAVMVVVMV
jgi:hypothetical protein